MAFLMPMRSVPYKLRCKRAAWGTAARALSTLRVAGVPEHFNAPFHLAKERGLYQAKGVDMQWNMTPQGTGAMGQKLDSDEVDVAVMLSEGAVARIVDGSKTKVIGTYVKSPLRWGIHVKRGSPIQKPADLKGKVFGVSRMLSGSHLMAHVFAHQQGWSPATDAPLKTVGTLDGAREAMGKDEIDAWLWEKFTTKHLVDNGEWDIIGEVPTPWPCFLFVASDRAIATKQDEIRNLVAVTKELCDEFKANAGDNTVEYVAKNHALSTGDAREWLGGTEWACALHVEKRTFDATQEALTTIGQIKQAVAHEQLYASELCQMT